MTRAGSIIWLGALMLGTALGVVLGIVLDHALK